MLSQNFDILAAALPIFGCISYAFDTLRNKTQPNRVSWLLWTIAPLIAFAAELAKHTDFRVSLLTFAVGFGPLLVIIASFINRNAYWKLTSFDYICGGISVLALILWAITGDGNIAIAFSIAADMFASLPTIKKAFYHPKTESVAAFVTSGLGGLIVLLTLKDWTLANFGFPLYLALVDLIISVLILLPRLSGDKRKKTILK